MGQCRFGTSYASYFVVHMKGTHLMKRSSYREQDYTFGQLMLTLRTKIGLTQVCLGEQLGVSRRAVAEWEAGSTYPKAEHLKAFIALCIQQQAFPTGHEAEEADALWKAAHQKVLLDERWTEGLLAKSLPPSVTVPVVHSLGTPWAKQRPRIDWGNAPDVPSFYGRERELITLAEWVIQERCRMVSVVGLGGIGKSALATSLMHQVAPHFEVVLWRSLRDAPTIASLLDDCLQVLVPQELLEANISLEKRIRLLLECIRRTRVLLVLDNLETLLQEGIDSGSIREGFEGYARLLALMAETEHQSCLLLTSREKPNDLEPLEGNRGPVRTFRLAGLDVNACQQLLADREVAGSKADQTELIEMYAGNPLALNIIAQTIVELFAGEIAPFLEQGEVVFGRVRQLLDEQFDRLADSEQMVLLWLAIACKPVTLSELRASLVKPRPSGELLEAVHRLRQRCLIEHGHQPGSFTLQSLVLEYLFLRLGGERLDHAVTACTHEPAWTFSGLRQGVHVELNKMNNSEIKPLEAWYVPQRQRPGLATPPAARSSARARG
jgi:DNA-binding XRE family transcriptional regulator